MNPPTLDGGFLPPEQHILAAQELLLAGHADPRAAHRAHTEAVLGAATAMLQLSETLTSLGALLAMHPVLAHALATHQAIGELHERIADIERTSATTAPPSRRQ